MKIDSWLKNSTASLLSAGIDSARLDCLILLEDELKQDRSWILAHGEEELESWQVGKLASWAEQRATHMPLAYIRGKAAFYGRDFMVNHHVLVPRPESEAIIEILKNINAHPGTTIIDVGTGSGALAITAQLELPHAKVSAVDIDEKCLDVARLNAKNHAANVTFLQGNLLKPLLDLATPIDIIIANLPYVPNDYKINKAATHEPRLALFGGDDGLDLYRELFAQIDQLDYKPLLIITEALPFQHKTLHTLAKNSSFEQIQTSGYIQLFASRTA